MFIVGIPNRSVREDDSRQTANNEPHRLDNHVCPLCRGDSIWGSHLIRAVITHQDWSGWTLPIPVEIGLLLVIITGVAVLSTVINLALKGFGAPFAIALSKKLAVDWLYAWTRNPMVLAVLAFLLSLGIWFQSALFVLWVLILFAPALLVFVKVYEERELEFRFGASYLEYKSRTPMLLPRRPRG
jgi:protein-S-isoprenylcysteine O-methyltransferase Ste14